MFEDNRLSVSSPDCSISRPSTLSERLKSKKLKLENDLAEVNSALNALTENPKLQEIFDQLSKINLY